MLAAGCLSALTTMLHEHILSQGTGGPTYIYSRYKGLGSTALPEEAFPVTFSRDGYRTKWIDTFLGS